ncbi:MAG: hypothetical protein JST82_07185 [Bacteroidetes bacterium]|nr:hypothetical protein [Bacteroidota bacterium]
MSRTSRLIDEDTVSDMIASIGEASFRMYYRSSETDRLKILTDSKYELEGKRYLLTYRNLKSASDVSLTGIDSNGRLIINSYSVRLRQAKYKYTVYVTVVNQIVFEKLNIEQLHYYKEKKARTGTGRHAAPY